MNNLNIFRLLRIARGITVKELSETLMVTPTYISNIETGRQFPSKRLLRDYAKALGVAEETILAFNSEDHQHKSFDKVLLAVLRIIGTLDE